MSNIVTRLGQRSLLRPSRIGRAITHDGNFMPKLNAGGTAYVDQDWEANAGALTPQQSFAAARLRRSSIGLLGDSRIDQGYSSSALTVAVYSESMFGVLNSLLDNRFVVAATKGVGGNTLAQMLARLSTDIFPYPMKYCFVWGSINDVLVDYTGQSPDVAFPAIRDRMIALLNALTNRGITPIVNTEAPLGTANANNLKTILRYNNWLLNLGPSSGVVVWPYHQIILDAAATPRNVATWFRDGVNAGQVPLHPNNLGCYWIAKSLVPLFQSLEPIRPWQSVAGEDWTTGANNSNLLDNPAFQGSGGSNTTALTGTVPASWNLTKAGGTPGGTVALVAVNNSAGLPIGNAFEITVGTTASGDEILLSSNDLTSRLPAACSVMAEARCEVASAANLASIQVWATTDPGGGTQATWGASKYPTGYSNGATSQNVVAGDVYAITTPLIARAASPTSSKIWMRLKFSGNGSGTIVRWATPRYAALT